MDDRAAFIEAIRDDPDDDTTRLVFADWLQDHGEDTFAEFVRCQVRAAALPPGSAEADALTDRADDLAAECESDWLGEWAEILVDWEYERGTFSTVTLTPSRFFEHGAVLLDRFPIDALRFVGEDGGRLTNAQIEAVVESPVFDRVPGLRTAGSAENPRGWLRPISRCDRPLRLSILDLSEADVINGEFVSALAVTPFASGLRSLDISGGWVTQTALDLLTRAPFGGLRDLALGNLVRSDSAGNDGGESAFHSLLGLRSLHLGSGYSLRALAYSELRDTLAELSLSTGEDLEESIRWVNRLRPTRLRATVRSDRDLNQFTEALRASGMKELRVLEVTNPERWSEITGDSCDRFVWALTKSPKLSSLTELEMPAVGVTDRGSHRLARWKTLGSLTRLGFHCGGQSPKAQQALFHSARFLGGRFRTLSLRGPIPEVDFSQIPRLRQLGLTQFAEHLLGQLGSPDNFRHLTGLAISWDMFGEDFRSLVDLPPPERLRSLEVSLPMWTYDPYAEAFQEPLDTLRSRYGPRFHFSWADTD